MSAGHVTQRNRLAGSGALAVVASLGVAGVVVACTAFSGEPSGSGDLDGGSSGLDGGGSDASVDGDVRPGVDAGADANANAEAGVDVDAGPPAPIAFVQNLGVAHSAVSTSMLTLSLVGQPTAGDLLVARFATNYYSGTPTTVTDSAGGTWHLDVDVSNNNVGTNQVWSARAAGALVKGSTIVFSFGANVQPYSLVVDEFSGSELASPAFAADDAGVAHIGATASDSTSDMLTFDAKGRTHVLALGFVVLQYDADYQEDVSDAGVIWQSLTPDFVLNMANGNLGIRGAYGIAGPKGTVTYAPSLGVSQNSVETIVLY